MNRKICLFFSYLGIFNLGMYTHHALNNGVIEDYRWILTSVFTLFFLIGAHAKDSRNG